MLPNIGVLGLAIPIPAFTLLIGIWVALNLIEKKSKLYSLQKKFIYNLAFNTLLIGIVGARVTFFLTNPNLLLSNPLGIISINSDMMYIPGGLLLASIFILITSNRKNIQLLNIMDGFTPGLAIFMVFLHLANLFSGNSFGAEANLPWSIELWNALRHPVQIYEMVAAGIIFFLVFRFGKNISNKTGTIFFLWLSLSAFSKLVLEAFHGDSQVIFSQFRVMQLAAWITLAISLLFIIKLNILQINVLGLS